MARELSTPVLIVGGGTGGVAAALACARAGVPCVLSEETDWLGGQLSTQAVPPDENQWIETVGANASYQALRRWVRGWYRHHTDVDPSRAGVEHLNPGGGWVSRLCAAPVVWREAIEAALAPHAARITRLMRHELVAAVAGAGDRIEAVALRSLESGERVLVRAAFVLDATETGDVLALGGVEHAVGAEHADVYGELHGRADFDATLRVDELDQQACSWCFALEHHAGVDFTVPRPQAYAWWRAHVPAMSPPWCGPLFSWTVPSHNEEGRRTFRMVPPPDEPPPGPDGTPEWEMWRYRRIRDAGLYRAERRGAHPDVTLINMVQMDFWQKPLLGGRRLVVSAADRAAALAGAREQSLCLLHWMQTEAPRHDGGNGYPGLRPAGELLGTADGFAKAVYVREPRRLMARTVVSERHMGTQQRRAEGWDRRDTAWGATPFGTAERFGDSVGIGHYMIDLHPSCAGRNNVYVPAAPFRVPLSALVPLRCTNVLAAGKCLGVSHIANGAYRMHHVEWSVGEAAGACAAWCTAHGLMPHGLCADAGRVEAFQGALRDAGVRTAWPWEA